MEIKISALAPVAAPLETDILPIVSDPSGTPVTRKATLAALLAAKQLYSIVPAGDFALAASGSAQNALPVPGDTFALAASKTYLLEAVFNVTKSGTSATTALLFALSGGLTLTSIRYQAIAVNAAVNSVGTAPALTNVDQATATVVNPTSGGDVSIQVKGLIRTNAAGNLVPQLQFSASPTTPVMKAGSYLRLTALDTDATNQGGSVS